MATALFRRLAIYKIFAWYKLQSFSNIIVVSNFITDFFYLVLKIIDWTYVSQHGTAIAFFVFSILKIVQLFGNILIVFLAWAVPKIVRKREEKTV